MATQSLRDSRLAGVYRLGALVLSLALGVLGVMLLLSMLRPAAVVSAPDEGDGPARPVSVASVPKASTGTTPTLHIPQTVDPTHLDTGGVVTICFTVWRPGLDVVLLHDVSGSMDEPAGEGLTGPSRLMAAQVAARALVSHLQRTDRAAVVPFSTHVYMSQVQPLATIVTDVLEAIDGLSARGWTNMGEGISVSHGQLMTGPGYVSDTVKAIVLLSDGNANCDEDGCARGKTEEGAEYALEKAAGAANDHIRIYTIGSGAEEAVNAGLLETVAMTTGGEYYFAPDPDFLEAAYLTMALGLHDLVITDVLTPDVKAHCPDGASYSCSQGAGGTMTVTWPVSDAALITNPLTLCFTATVNLDPGYIGLINDPDSQFCYQDANGEIDCRSFVNRTVTVTGRKITGFVYYDRDGDGDRDSGESGVCSVTVKTGTGLTTTTDVSGSYVLRISSEPAVSVTTEIPPGYVSTTPISRHISAETGVYTAVNFGIRGIDGVVYVQGKVFYDANANGRDDGEEGLAGATITASGAPPTVTEGSGTFSLCVPVSGDTITITETDPNRCTSTAAIAGDGVRVVDSNTLCIDDPEAGRTYGGNKFGDVRWLAYFPIIMRGYAAPSLHLSTKTVDRWKACAGEILRYTITLTNSGTIEPISAVVTDPIPVDCTYVPGSVTVSCAYRGDIPPAASFEDGQIRWGTATLSPVERCDIAFKVQINDDVCNAVITNTAEVLEIRNGRGNLLPPLTATTRVPVINGGFEEGWIGWRHGGELSQTIALTNAHSGNRSALLGSPDYPCRDVPVGRAWIEQTVCVPSTASPTLSFWYDIWTFDRNSNLSNAYDLFDVKINDVQVFADMNRTEPYGCKDPVTRLGWKQGAIDLSGYRSSSITVRFETWSRPADPYKVQTAVYNTWTYVDDVRIDR